VDCGQYVLGQPTGHHAKLYRRQVRQGQGCCACCVKGLQVLQCSAVSCFRLRGVGCPQACILQLTKFHVHSWLVEGVSWRVLRVVRVNCRGRRQGHACMLCKVVLSAVLNRAVMSRCPSVHCLFGRAGWRTQMWCTMLLRCPCYAMLRVWGLGMSAHAFALCWHCVQRRRCCRAPKLRIAPAQQPYPRGAESWLHVLVVQCDALVQTMCWWCSAMRWCKQCVGGAVPCAGANKDTHTLLTRCTLLLLLLLLDLPAAGRSAAAAEHLLPRLPAPARALGLPHTQQLQGIILQQVCAGVWGGGKNGKNGRN
jgi:hypothetical protein